MPRSDTDLLDPGMERELAAIDATLRGEAVEPDLADLAELTRLLHDERPRIDAGFATSLNARRERGFRPAAEAAGGGGRVPGLVARLRAFGASRPLIPAMGIAASLLIAVVVATSVIGGKDDPGSSLSATSNGESGQKEAARPAQPEAGVVQGGSGAAAAADEAALPVRRGRSVERQANLALVTAADKIDEVARKVIRTADAVGGIVVSSNIETTSSGGSATFELRVPSRRLEEALAKLSDLADVRSRSQNSQDITSTVVSARERLDEYLAERKSLLRQLANADTGNETASLKGRLRIVNGQIIAARAEMRRLNERTSYSVVRVTVEPKGHNTVIGPGGDDTWNIGDAWKDARRVLEVAAGIAIMALAIAIPFGLLGAAGGFGGRRALRRRRERALDMAA
jgi:hypothetical protein